MKSLLDLLISLRRHELTALTAHGQMSPREAFALKTRLGLVRGTIPSHILQHYDALKRKKRIAGERPALLAMETLVATYQGLPIRKRRTMTSFFDLAGYSPRS